jgi:peptidoglycan/xylan/chitin deacetylase (PgdA/CDA1 family)
MITYDTEMFGREFGALHRWLGDRVDDHAITDRWIDQAQEVHGRAGAPCTSYVVGKLLEQHSAGFAALATNPLFNLESHTYSHQPLRTIVMESPEYVRRFMADRAGEPGVDAERGVTCGRFVPVELVREEIVRTRELLRSVCGVESIGISGPGGYYRGLSDRLDLLQVLWEEGIRFSRCYSRNEHDFSPVPLEAQPFWYRAQGFPDILEIPANDWQDVFWRDFHGWDNIAGYLAHLKGCLDRVVERDLVFTYCTHEWSCLEHDPKMSVIAELIAYAQDRGVEILSQRQYYQRRLAERAAPAA